MYVSNCKWCDKEFSNPHKGRPYCGRVCYGLAKRRQTAHICPVCKQQFTANTRAQRKFCSHKCQGLERRKHSNPNHGYYMNGMQTVHRMIAESVYGKLPHGAVVHHIDGNPSNNSKGNLLICTVSYHMWLHQEMSRRYAQEHFGGE